MIERRRLRNGNEGGGTRPRRRTGRPGVYGPDKVEAARIAMQYGMTEFELAKMCGISISTLHVWAKQHPDFSTALKTTKEGPDERVKRSLFHRAVGYSFEAEKIFYNSRTGEVERVPYIEHVPPDTTAAIFWLKNRDPANWRETGTNGKLDDGGPLSIQEAQVQLLARVFGVVARLGARQAAEAEARTIEAEPSGGV